MRYFAYGSNMLTSRLKERVPSARPLGKAYLKQHTLVWDKKSFRDGSGKCHVVKSSNERAVVWGVLYNIDASDKPNLDRIEGKGYGQKKVTVYHDEEPVEAYTYVATAIKTGLKPYRWYKSLVLKGAREHDLPEPYIRQLAEIESIDDQENQRIRKVRHLLSEEKDY